MSGTFGLQETRGSDATKIKCLKALIPSIMEDFLEDPVDGNHQTCSSLMTAGGGDLQKRGPELPPIQL